VIAKCKRQRSRGFSLRGVEHGATDGAILPARVLKRAAVLTPPRAHPWRGFPLDAPALNYKISLIDGNPERAHCKRPEPAAPERRAGAATTRAGEARARHDRYDHSKNAGLLTRLGCNYPLPNRI
jgi:hypothetical protein